MLSFSCWHGHAGHSKMCPRAKVCGPLVQGQNVRSTIKFMVRVTLLVLDHFLFDTTFFQYI